MISFTMPYPPSVNRYYRTFKGRILISAIGRTYRKEIIACMFAYRNKFKATDRLSIAIDAHVPDRRKRDLDNLLKCTFDSLTHADVIPDDENFDEITIRRKELINGGLLRVTISIIK